MTKPAWPLEPTWRLILIWIIVAPPVVSNIPVWVPAASILFGKIENPGDQARDPDSRVVFMTHTTPRGLIPPMARAVACRGPDGPRGPP